MLHIKWRHAVLTQVLMSCGIQRTQRMEVKAFEAHFHRA